MTEFSGSWLLWNREMEGRVAGKRKRIAFEIDDSGCHNCTSHALGTHGYPCLWKDGRNQNMHRVLYEEKYGSLGNLVARHSCDNPRCINLDHVSPGTPADNTGDITERGRHNPPAGERSGTAKLTIKDVEKIRFATGPQSKTAKDFGIAQSTVSRIKSHKRWSHHE